MTRWAFDSEQPDELVTIRTFENHAEFLLARGLLESAGIECFSRDEHTMRISSAMHRSLAGHGTALQVRKRDAEDAIAILDAPPFEEGFVVEE